MRRAFVLLAMLAAPAFAGPKKAAPKPTPPPPPAETGDAPEVTPSPTPQHGEGDYGGVVPGQPRKQEGKHPTKPPPKGTLSWIGFEAKGGGAEVFFQSVAPFDVTQHVEGGTLFIYLKLDRLGQNTWRPIDARFFESPLARIVARRVGAARGKNAHPAGIEVRISFKNAKDAKEGQLRSATEADGYSYAYLSWAGTGGSEAATVQDPEK